MSIYKLKEAVKDCYVENKQLNYDTTNVTFDEESMKDILILACMENLDITINNDVINFKGNIIEEIRGEITDVQKKRYKARKWQNKIKEEISYKENYSKNYDDLIDSLDACVCEVNKYRKVNKSDINLLNTIKNTLKLYNINANIRIGETLAIIEAEEKEFKLDEKQIHKIIQIAKCVSGFSVFAIYNWEKMILMKY
ncbi:MAG: hypothetical protein RR136_03260 [Clostridia bacterium]